ncbi:MAG: hypothetical protein Q8N94_07175 [Methanoregula sp.]|nr:hypothetical protein [Methanoregula sp.]
MGKKTKDDIESSAKKGKRGKIPFSFLGNQFDTIDTKTVKRHILFLVLASVMTKLLVVFFTTSMFHSFVDLFDIGVYFQHAIMPLQGQYPFGAADFQYPILVFVPMMIAIVPALLLQNAMAFVYTFQILMVLCDIITILCVYLIGLRLWDERTAFYSGLLYATAFSAAYFVITKYDAFPACLLMLAITFTLYGKEFKGYAASIIGFFTKVFPVLALPFFVLYNAKGTSLRQEVIRAAKVVIPISAVLFLPLFFLSPDSLKIYVPIRSELGYYSNTATFTMYSWIHDVFRLGVSIEAISAVMYIFMATGILALFYIAYIIPEKNPKLLIKLILCALILVIICAKVRSPQYIVWFTPLICILAVDDIKKIVLLYIVQGLAYIEFPLMFGVFYTAVQYTEPVLSSGWMLTLMMFTLEYLALFVCIWVVVNPMEIYTKIRTGQK